MAGAAGLRWDDLDPQRTPNLWRQASRGSVGWLSVRSAHRTTCPADGWLTLGAGNYAAWSTETVRGACPAMAPDLTEPDRSRREHRPAALDRADQPGRSCPTGRCPARWPSRCAARWPSAPARRSRRPARSAGSTGTSRSCPRTRRTCCRPACSASSTWARSPGPAPTRQAAGGAAPTPPWPGWWPGARTARCCWSPASPDTDSTSRLHVAIAEGQGWNGGWLTSAGTGRDGYLQLVDLAPTALAAVGRAGAGRLFAGRGRHVGARPPGEPGRRGRRRARRRPAGRRPAGRRRRVLHRAGRRTAAALHPGRAADGPGAAARRTARPGCCRGGCWSTRLEIALIAAALAIPAALLADAAPWWRTGRPGLVFGAVTLLLIAARHRRRSASPRAIARTLWPMGGGGRVRRRGGRRRPAHRRAAAAQRRGRLLGAAGRPVRRASAASAWACSSPGCWWRPAAWPQRIRKPLAPGGRGADRRRSAWSWSAARTWAPTRSARSP